MKRPLLILFALVILNAPTVVCQCQSYSVYFIFQTLSITINILLILKVQVIFFWQTFGGIFQGDKKIKISLKTPKKCPLIICFAEEREINLHTLRIRGTLVFYVPIYTIYIYMYRYMKVQLIIFLN